jgi:hypothetical protein
MAPRRHFRFIGAIIFVALIAAAIHLLALHRVVAPSTFTRTYVNTDWGFMLQMPAGYAVYPPHPSAGRDEDGNLVGEALVFKNSSGGIVNFTIVPAERPWGNTLTVDDLAAELPGAALSEAEPIQIAPGVMGVMLGDGSPYEGSVWFTYRGTFYEADAPAADHAALMSMISSIVFL